MKILFVEDDPNISQLVERLLQREGFLVETSSVLEGVEARLRSDAIDLLLLDRSLPGGDGIDLCRQLRQNRVTTPILVLTARASLADRVEGLDAGADDYLVKPFAGEELVARIQALLRRPNKTFASVVQWDDLTLNVAAKTVTIHQKEIVFTRQEFLVFERLLLHRGVTVPRETLIEQAWDRNFDGWSNVVDVHLKNIRKKLPFRYARRIRTVRGQGYRLD